jgi:hypothetical protein
MPLRSLSLCAALALSLVQLGPAAAAEPNFVYQRVALPAFASPHTYVLSGMRTSAGCTYSYPTFRPPAGVSRWEVRDVGIDAAGCSKLVEEGVPAADGPTTSDRPLAGAILSVGGSATATASTSTNASGYAHAWFENVYGQTLTSDTTYLTWTYTGSCVTASSSYGQWNWDYGFGWNIVSYNGSRSQSCGYAFGSTWSTFKNFSCYHYYSYVNTYGWYDGTFRAGRSDSATCGPIWEHFVYVRTT